MSHIKNTLSLIAVTILVAACGPAPTTVQIDRAFHEWAPAHAELIAKLPTEDAALMAKFVPEYLEAYKNSESRVPGLNYPFNLGGKTLGDAVIAARDFYAQKDRVLGEIAAKEKTHADAIERRRVQAAAQESARKTAIASSAIVAAEEARLATLIPECKPGQLAMKVVNWHQAPWGGGGAQFERIDITVADARSDAILFQGRVEKDEPVAKHKPGRNFCWTQGDWDTFCSITYAGPVCELADSKRAKRIANHRSDS